MIIRTIVDAENTKNLTGTKLIVAWISECATRSATYDATAKVWVVRWNTVDMPNGTYRLDAKGLDDAGREFLAAPVSVRVANEAAQQPRAFAVRVTAPAGGSTLVGQVALVEPL